jgi:hypothetical protein
LELGERAFECGPAVQAQLRVGGVYVPPDDPRPGPRPAGPALLRRRVPVRHRVRLTRPEWDQMLMHDTGHDTQMFPHALARPRSTLWYRMTSQDMTHRCSHMH